MALTFPLSLTKYMKSLPLRTSVNGLTEAIEVNEYGNGKIVTSEYGPRLWWGRITLRTMEHAQSEKFLALTRALFHPRATFFFTPLQMPGVSPNGTLYAVQNNRSIRIGGLANGRKVLAGSYVSFQYGSNPTRYAFHQLLEDATADTAGNTGYVEVEPAIEPGYGTGATLVLYQPYLKARAVPGSMEDPEHEGRNSAGWSFEWRQDIG